jgi:hypothetical protein
MLPSILALTTETSAKKPALVPSRSEVKKIVQLKGGESGKSTKISAAVELAVQTTNAFDTEDGSSWAIHEKSFPLVNIFTMGWMEDGRLGYAPDVASYIQTYPRPIFKLDEQGKSHEKYVCKSVSAGSRHTLMLMISCNPLRNQKPPEIGKHHAHAAAPTKPKPLRKLMLTGLNQLALCEEKGFMEPVEVFWDVDEDPMEVFAGNGNCFVLTSSRDVYSWGHGRFGALGHGNNISNQIPTLISHFQRERIRTIACGGHHVIATTVSGLGFAWGKNTSGQLGIDEESDLELIPRKVALQRGEQILDISCGLDHTVALVRVAQLDSTEKTTVFCWGDASRGQLGSGDAKHRCRPQENRWVTRFAMKKRVVVANVCAGGHHCLAIVNAPSSSKNVFPVFLSSLMSPLQFCRFWTNFSVGSWRLWSTGNRLFVGRSAAHTVKWN